MRNGVLFYSIVTRPHPLRQSLRQYERFRRLADTGIDTREEYRESRGDDRDDSRLCRNDD